MSVMVKVCSSGVLSICRVPMFHRTAYKNMIYKIARKTQAFSREFFYMIPFYNLDAEMYQGVDIVENQADIDNNILNPLVDTEIINHDISSTTKLCDNSLSRRVIRVDIDNNLS